MKPDEVIQLWGELTGEKWRRGLVPYNVGREAAEFAAAGFTREEMELVVRYTQRMIANQEGGFNAQSITWRVMAMDRWQKFQERLTAASKTKLGKRILQGTTTHATPATGPRPTSEAEAERIRQQSKAEMEKLRSTLGR